MTKSKKVVVWGGEDILSLSIELFLTTKKDWEVVRISNKEAFDAVTLAVETQKADIVLIQEGDQTCPPEQIMQLLQDYPHLRVIMVCLETNLIDVYSKQEILTKDPSDLIRVIENEPCISTVQPYQGEE